MLGNVQCFPKLRVCVIVDEHCSQSAFCVLKRTLPSTASTTAATGDRRLETARWEASALALRGGPVTTTLARSAACLDRHRGIPMMHSGWNTATLEHMTNAFNHICCLQFCSIQSVPYNKLPNKSFEIQQKSDHFGNSRS